MKRVFVLMAVVALCLAACAQKKDGNKSFDDKKPRNGNGMMVNKDTDSVYAALKNETLDKFQQFIYEDSETGKTIQFNLFVPEAFDGLLKECETLQNCLKTKVLNPFRHMECKTPPNRARLIGSSAHQ